MSTLGGTEKSCGSGCEGGGCSSTSLLREDNYRTAGEKRVIPEIQTDVIFSSRRLNLNSTPVTGTYITSIDMDLTVACNLRCTYCFKEKWNEHMEDQVAYDTMIWLLYASGPLKSVHVNFMGGEPLIRFKLIKKIVPFAKRRAWQMGKSVSFGMTTNGTLVSDKVVEFWREWGMGFHTSIDGTKEIQDLNRPMVSGHGSARLVEKSVPKILEYRPNTTARSTVVPESTHSLVESFKYFRRLGYVSIAFVPGSPSAWDKETNAIFEEQFSKVGEMVVKEYENGHALRIKGIDEAIKGIVRNKRPQHACGAGRGLVLIDIHGDIWPCHRWNKASEKSWNIGNIYKQFDDLVRAELDVKCQSEMLEQDCENCIANSFCGGGCPAENLEETGSVYKRHLNACEHTRVYARVGKKVHDELLRRKNELFLAQYYEEQTRKN